MPKYEVTTPQGKLLKFESDNELSPQEIDETVNYFEVNDYRPTESSEIRNYTTEELRALAEEDYDKDFNLSQFTTGIGKGAMELLRLGALATEEIGGAVMGGDFKKLGSTAIESVARASFDLADMGEAIAGRAGDLLESDREAIIARRVERMRQDQLDQAKRARGFAFTPEEVLPSATEVGSFVLDPTNLIGVGLAGKAGKVAGLGAKAQAVLDSPNMLMRKALDRGVRIGASATGSVLGATAKVLEAPLKVTSSAFDKSGRLLGRPRDIVNKVIASTTNADERFIRNVTGSVGALHSPAVQAEMIAKGGAFAAKNLPKVLNDTARIFNILGDTDRQFRFLKEVATNPSVSKKTRDLIAIAGNGTQKGLDMAFNAVANGVSAGTLQAIMAKMQTNDSEALGSAFGSGLLFGAAIPTGQVPSALGKLTGADADKVFFDTRLKLETARAMETFKKTDPASAALMNQLAINGAQAKVHLFHAPEYKAHYKAETGENIRDSKAVWEDGNGEIYLNVNNKKAAPQLLNVLSSRIAKDVIDKDPTLKGRISKELDPDGVLDADELVDKFIKDRFSKFVSGKLDASNITSATSKNLYTQDLLEKTITSVMDKMGLLEVNKAGDMPSISKKLLSNPYIKNLNDNYNVMKGAIARKRVDMAKEGIARTDAEIAKAEAEEKSLLQEQVKREVADEKKKLKIDKILSDDDVKAQEDLIDREVAKTQRDILIQKQEKKAQLTEDKKQLQREAIGYNIELQRQKDSEERNNLLKQRKAYIDAVTAQSKLNDYTVIQPRVTDGGIFNIGTTVGSNVMLATPTKGYIKGVNPREFLQTMEVAKSNELPVSIDGMTTRSYELINEGGKAETIYKPEPFKTDEFFVIQYQNPRTERANTAILADGIVMRDAELFIDRMREQLGISPNANIRDIIYKDLNNFNAMNAAIDNNALQLARKPEMDRNVVAQMIRATDNKSKLSSDDRKRLPFKSFDPHLMIDVQINRTFQ